MCIQKTTATGPWANTQGTGPINIDVFSPADLFTRHVSTRDEQE